jgi:hypothetical protein
MKESKSVANDSGAPAKWIVSKTYSWADLDAARGAQTRWVTGIR